MEFGETVVCQFVQPLNLFYWEILVIVVAISKLLHKEVIVSTTREPNECVSGGFARTKIDAIIEWS